MKKKFLSFILALCLIIPCSFILSACGEDDDPPAEPVHHGITIRTLNNLNDKLDSIEIFCGDREAVSETEFYSGTIKEGEENVFIKLKAKQSVKYTEEDVILTENDNKEFSKSIEIKNDGITQNIIEITISNIKNDCFFKLGLEDSDEIHQIASMPIEFNYDIRYTSSSNDQIVLTGLEESFDSISVWSDKANRFISYNDTKADNTLSTELELQNINVNEFKVYVRFATNLILFNSKTLNNLVVLRQANSSELDVPLTFNPQAVKKDGVECYEYTLDIDKFQHNITENSKIVLTYQNDLGRISGLTVREIEDMAVLDYVEFDGHKFSQTTYRDNLTDNREIVATIVEPSANSVKKLNEAGTYKMIVGVNGSSEYVDYSKIDVYVGNKESGIKAEYKEDGYHYVTIPVNAYPSQYGNAEYFYLTAVPNVQNIDDVIDTENYAVVPVTTVVENVAMYNVTENVGELWRTELSQDGKTQTQYFVVEKNAKDLYYNSILPLNKKFYYANYDDITVKVTFNGHVNYINFDFKTIYNNNLSLGGTLDLLCDDQYYYIQNNYYVSGDTSYVEYSVSQEIVEFRPIRLSTNTAYDGNGIKYEIISGTVSKSALKGYSYYYDGNNGGTEIEVATSLVIKHGNDVITPSNGVYELERGVIYNFELTILNTPDLATPSYMYDLICSISEWTVYEENGDSHTETNGEITYKEINGKFIGTICINTPFDSFGLVDCFTLGIRY